MTAARRWSRPASPTRCRAPTTGSCAAMAELVGPGLVVRRGRLVRPAPVAAVAGAAGRSSPDGDVPGAAARDGLARHRPARSTAGARPCGGTTSPRSSSPPGSTGTPKGVLNTHGMLSANQQQMPQAWPFLAGEPPVLLDWLPWSHTFGGNHNLGMVLATAARCGSTTAVRRRRWSAGRCATWPTCARPSTSTCRPATRCSLPHLERDRAAARAFFAGCGSASSPPRRCPQQLWDRLRGARRPTSRRADADDHLVGARPRRRRRRRRRTSRSPAATARRAAARRRARRSCRSGEKMEVRVRGANVTPGYHGRPDLTEAAFDEEGFFRTGDAVALRRPGRPAAGPAVPTAASPRTSSCRPAPSSASGRCGPRCCPARRGC